MKKILPLIVLMLPVLWAKAQVTTGLVELNKVQQNAVIGDFAFAPDIIETVLQDEMKVNGFGKGESYKGFRKFAGIVFKELSPNKLDFYYKVEAKSRKEKNSSMVYMVFGTSFDTIASETANPELFANAKKYLLGLSDKFAQQRTRVAIEEQNDVIEKAERKMKSLVGNGESLKTRLKETQDAIVKNQQDQDEQKKVLENERKTLENLKSQLK